jgi:CBS domain containing-hemolysin-like protein
MSIEHLLLTSIGPLLVLLDGFFVAAEFAIVKRRSAIRDRHRLGRYGNWRPHVPTPRSLSLLSLEQALRVLTPEADANSVDDLVTETLGRIPVTGERIACPEFDIEVLPMEGSRIDTVRVPPPRVRRLRPAPCRAARP